MLKRKSSIRYKTKKGIYCNRDIYFNDAKSTSEVNLVKFAKQCLQFIPVLFRGILFIKYIYLKQSIAYNLLISVRFIAIHISLQYKENYFYT